MKMAITPDPLYGIFDMCNTSRQPYAILGLDSRTSGLKLCRSHAGGLP